MRNRERSGAYNEVEDEDEACERRVAPDALLVLDHGRYSNIVMGSDLDRECTLIVTLSPRRIVICKCVATEADIF